MSLRAHVSSCSCVFVLMCLRAHESSCLQRQWRWRPSTRSDRTNRLRSIMTATVSASKRACKGEPLSLSVVCISVSCCRCFLSILLHVLSLSLSPCSRALPPRSLSLPLPSCPPPLFAARQVLTPLFYVGLFSNSFSAKNNL